MLSHNFSIISQIVPTFSQLSSVCFNCFSFFLTYSHFFWIFLNPFSILLNSSKLFLCFLSFSQLFSFFCVKYKSELAVYIITITEWYSYVNKYEMTWISKHQILKSNFKSLLARPKNDKIHREHLSCQQLCV